VFPANLIVDGVAVSSRQVLKEADWIGGAEFPERIPNQVVLKARWKAVRRTWHGDQRFI
jgi:hypothetical protein